MDTVLEAVRRHARERASERVYWSPARSWTFAELDAAANRVAQGLLALGVAPSERVACLTKHTAECVALVLGANKIGAVCMPVNWRLAAPEIEYIVNNGEARLMMVDAAFLPVWREVSAPTVRLTLATDQAPEGTQTFPAWREQFEPRETGLAPALDDTALQLYSSGTTGLPKGVELTHRNLAAGMVDAVPEAIQYRGPGDVMLNVLPTYHIATPTPAIW